MLIAWTTVADRAGAEALAAEAVERGYAVCVQVDGPVRSYYRWQGKVECAGEYRLCFKFLATQRSALDAWIQERHPYDTPEWVVVESAAVGEKYLSWAMGNASVQPFPYSTPL